MSNYENKLHATKPHSKKNEDLKVMVDVKRFHPDDVEVKVVDNFVIIHGRHGEKVDQPGLVSRRFTRRFKLPDGADPDTVKATWREDGVLVVIVPKKYPANERDVPIILAKSDVENIMQEHEDMLKVIRMEIRELHNKLRRKILLMA